MNFSKDVWVILNPIEQSIRKKIEKFGTPLKDWNISINYGIKTGCNEAFIIDGAKRAELIAADPKSDEIIRPILRGRDIKRNGYEFADLWLINIECGYTNAHRGSTPPEEFIQERYPAIYQHFQDVASRPTRGKGLKGRDDMGDYWWELRSCAYTNDFSKQKIVFSRISGNEPCFAADDAGMMTNDTGYIITGEHIDYLLEKLCSNVYWYAFKSFYMGGGIDKEFKVNNLNNLPIPLPGTPEPDLTDEENNFILKSLQ